MAEGVGISNTLNRGINDLPGEIWEDVPGYNGKYQVSQYSRVKSLIKKNPVILKKSLSDGKHKVVLIGKYGRLISECVDRLCASVHLRPPLENEVICHKDGNKLNTIVGNLKWITWQESRQKTILHYRSRNIRFNSGSENGRAVINEAIARGIREERNKGFTYSQIALKYKVSVGIVQRVVQNRTWKTH
ncbi:hypothetical protein EG359_17400 [Chryseobacterium joostei]|uniref:NUMOD4 motif-containing protein n=1 Tax=Chryseobacterium joostei TaxID=112234 RepID=A0A1N7IB44_9FLAO|nr:NUMOD4 domain-containing protein [Chryseobacterium joostei]AZB01280.1 hypothetical protein EG359_17400 [Chryseobacterium joostei]SIS34277.1 NUMOD4 motif-containing protein [Chryseobacterium joostei]